MKWITNHPAPPIKMASTFGQQWVGVPQHILRLTTIRINLPRAK